MQHLIMIIEDEEALALMLRYNLEKEGYQVAVESRGSKAIAEIEKNSPSVILLDWMLPEMSGVEICKLIRSKPDIKNIPVIMLTAKGEEEDKIKGLSVGADDYVTKPFSVPELMARVKAQLRRAPEPHTEKELLFEDLRMDLVEKKVFRGEITVDDSVELAKNEIAEVFRKKELPPEKDEDDGFVGDEAGKCPLCGEPVRRTKFGYGCSGYKNGCKFALSNVILERVISLENVKSLLKTGKTSKIEGFVSQRTCKEFSAYLTLENGRAVFKF